MNNRVTHAIQPRRTGYVAQVFVDAYKVAQQTCASEAEALAWIAAKVAEVALEVR